VVALPPGTLEAAQDADIAWARQDGRRRGWQRVPDAQVLRLLAGAESVIRGDERERVLAMGDEMDETDAIRAGGGFQALLAVINRIAGEVNFPLGAAAELLTAIGAYAEQRKSDAVTAERERIRQLAAEHAAYCPQDPARPFTSPRHPFADLLGDPPPGGGA
jgi:hypothetical protein